MKEKQENISRIILDYLRKNPNDRTLKGISQWYLKHKEIEISVDEVANTLKSLIEAGLIEREETDGCDPFYKVSNKI